MLRHLSRKLTRHYVSYRYDGYRSVYFSSTLNACNGAYELLKPPHYCSTKWSPAEPYRDLWGHDLQPVPSRFTNAVLLSGAGRQERCFSSIASGEPHHKQPRDQGAADKTVLYRGKGMVPFRVLVRLKIFQLAGVAALAIPINTFLVQGSVSSIQAVMATALVVGCGAASVTLWYYSRRYVGELSLRRRPGDGQPHVCFSVLDFWGNREDNLVAPERLIPPLQGCSATELRQIAEQTLLPVDVEGDRQYILSLRHGHLVNKQRLMEVLKGSLMKEHNQI